MKEQEHQIIAEQTVLKQSQDELKLRAREIIADRQEVDQDGETAPRAYTERGVCFARLASDDGHPDPGGSFSS